jgi:hypothetical protein
MYSNDSGQLFGPPFDANDDPQAAGSDASYQQPGGPVSDLLNDAAQATYLDLFPTTSAGEPSALFTSGEGSSTSTFDDPFQFLDQYHPIYNPYAFRYAVKVQQVS